MNKIKVLIIIIVCVTVSSIVTYAYFNPIPLEIQNYLPIILSAFSLFFLGIITNILKRIAKILHFMREDMLDVFVGKYSPKTQSELLEPISKEELDKLKRKIFGESHYDKRPRPT